jgi:hypothetical protein
MPGNLSDPRLPGYNNFFGPEFLLEAFCHKVKFAFCNMWAYNWHFFIPLPSYNLHIQRKNYLILGLKVDYQVTPALGF